jgi:predicted aspartyl protease
MKRATGAVTGLLGIALLLSSAQSRARQSQADASTKQNDTRESSVPDQKGVRIPFELDGNIIFLKVQANGSEPLAFVLDTGATLTVLDTDQARKLGIEQFEDFPAIFKVPSDFRRVRGVHLRLVGLELSNQTMAVGPMDANQLIHSGRHLHGVLGRNLFSQFVVEIDYVARFITLYDPKTYQYSGVGESIPLELSGSPFVRVTITTAAGHTMERLLFVDTGSHATLNYETSQFPSRTIERDEMDLTNQVTARVRAVFARVEHIELGHFVLAQPVVGVTHSFPLRGVQGLLGGGLLRRFTVIFDYAQKRMILEPNERTHDPFEFDMSGMFVISDLPSSRNFKVFSVSPKTPAADAGLHEGDLITAVNGEPSARFDVASLTRDRFLEVGRVYRLSVKRGTKQLRMTLKLRRLI